MRYEYSDFFSINPDGSAVSEFPIRILGTNVTMPAGTIFRPGVPFEGYDIANLAGHKFKATIHEEHGDEVLVISKFY